MDLNNAALPRPQLSFACPPGGRSVEHSRIAESLGYERVWLFDSPSMYTDIWVSLARIADATERIGLGTGVAVPSMRHPMVTASAIAAVEELAPGRLVVAFGTGFTARLTMGQKPMRWSALVEYTRQVRALLDGAVVQIDGGACQMMHVDDLAPQRPIRVPLWVAPSGPKGMRAARDLGVEGVLVISPPDEPLDCAHRGLLVFGTVIRPGEDETSSRVLAAVGPSYTTTVHGLWDVAPALLSSIPGGQEWHARVNADRPDGERHLIVHRGHLSSVTDRDRDLVHAAGSTILGTGWTGDAASIAARLDDAAGRGITEILYIPAGPDVPAELEAFSKAAQL
jgi:5,10-methylenetetrahydromethanopterin reductase